MDLLTLARENDMPPKWEGCVVVEWTPWEAQPPVFICPPSKSRDCCPSCGSPHPSVHCRGLVAVSTVITREKYEADEANRQRLGWAAHKRKPLALWRLSAFRCQDCMHDTVWDVDTDLWWDLEPNDYGPAGA